MSTIRKLRLIAVSIPQAYELWRGLRGIDDASLRWWVFAMIRFNLDGWAEYERAIAAVDQRGVGS